MIEDKIPDSSTQTTEHSSQPQISQQPTLKRIVESTKQIINSQAIKIFELTNEVRQLKRENETLRNHYHTVLKYWGHDSKDGQNADFVMRDIVAKIEGLETELISAKMELAQTKAEILGLKFKSMKENKFTINPSQMLSIPEVKKLRSILENNVSLENGEDNSLLMEWRKFTDKYLSGYPRILRFKEKTAGLIKKGLPHSLRESLWPIIFENRLGISSALYSELAARRYKDKDYSQKVVSQINKDICRSFNGKTQFDSKVGLDIEVTEILEVFHLYRPDVSYVQGMTYPAIVLNLVVGKYKAFSIFCNLIISNDFFRRLYTFEQGYPSCYCRAFDYLLEEKMPKIARLLKEKGVPSQLYLIEWFYTFFSRGLSYEFTLKIWDNLAYEGELLFYKLGLSIFELIEDTLLDESDESSEPSSIIRCFSDYLSQYKLQQVLHSQKLTGIILEKTIDMADRLRKPKP